MSAPDTAFSFLWFWENYSYAGLHDGFYSSPVFEAEGLERTSWQLGLNPFRLQERGSVSLYLWRNDDAGPETLSVQIEISIINAYGSVLYSERCEHAFGKGGERCFEAFVDMDELFVRKNTDFLPRDTLGVRCRVWRGEESAQNVKQYTARTLFDIEKLCFVHRIRKFSHLKKGEKNIVRIPSHSKEGCVLSSELSISEDSPEGSMVVKVESSGYNHFFKRNQISVIVFGEIIKLIDIDERFKDAYEKEKEFLKSFTKQFFLDRREEFLPNDELTLFCDCTFYTGYKSSKIIEDQQEFPVTTGKVRIYNQHTTNNSKVKEQSASLIASEKVKSSNDDQDKQSTCPTALDAFKALKSDQFLADVHLKTETVKRSSNPIASETQKRNNFEKCSPSHPTALDEFKALYKDQLLTVDQMKSVAKPFSGDKTVVCARSSASRSMLRQDAKAKSTYCVRVDDSEDEIGRALLLFYYSDSLKDLRWESALRIYHDASSHAVKSLQILSSYFLVDNLGTTNASQLLLLADRHADKQLKEIVENFILEHDKEVFSSEGWEKLGQTNSQLGMKTMLLKYRREISAKYTYNKLRNCILCLFVGLFVLTLYNFFPLDQFQSNLGHLFLFIHKE